MHKILFSIFSLVSIGLIILIICQQGKDAYMDFSFGSEISGIFSGMKSSESFLTKITSVFSVLFFVLSLIMNNYYISIQEKKEIDFFKKKGNSYEIRSKEVRN